MTTKKQKGFTLIELMVAVIIGLILLLATGMALIIGQTSWHKAWKEVSLQRDASYAMLKISHTIKEGVSAQLDNDGKAVTIYGEGGQTAFFLDQNSNNLNYQIHGQEPQTIISGGVEDVIFTLQGNLLGIDLRLKKDNLRTRFVTTVMMRNYGG